MTFQISNFNNHATCTHFISEEEMAMGLSGLYNAVVFHPREVSNKMHLLGMLCYYLSCPGGMGWNKKELHYGDLSLSKSAVSHAQWSERDSEKQHRSSRTRICTFPVNDQIHMVIDIVELIWNRGTNELLISYLHSNEQPFMNKLHGPYEIKFPYSDDSSPAEITLTVTDADKLVDIIKANNDPDYNWITEVIKREEYRQSRSENIGVTGGRFL